MNKTAIRKFAEWAREKLIEDIKYKAGTVGITANGIAEKLPQSTSDTYFYDVGTKDYMKISGVEIKQRDALVKAIQTKERSYKSYQEAFENVIEEVAYTWFNRLIAIRFMEVNDYLPFGVRVLSSENKAKKEPDLVTTPLDTDLEFTSYEQDRIIQLKDDNKLDELFRMLFIKQCNKLHDILPELFEKTDDYSELLLTISFTDPEGIIHHLINDIEDVDFRINDEMYTDDGKIKADGQVEIIGWLYQYYISKKHDEIVNIYKGTVKKADIPAATQLFTTDWVVRYMVDNSLGRYWIERNPQSKLAEKLEFFVTPKNGEIQYVDEKINPTDLTFFDPCMGSGHILVYAFDVLMEIYREVGYSDRDAVLSIVENNLFGMDIDKRAYQLAYFAVMMKARSYNRRALTKGISNNLSVVEESNFIDKFSCDSLTTDSEQNKIGEYLVEAYRDAQEIGTLQTIEKKDYNGFVTYLNNIDSSAGQIDLFSTAWLNDTLPQMLQLTKQAEIMSNKYAVVCTNPPYMNKLEGQLKKFVVDNYKAYSGDLFSVFIYRNFDYCKVDGYSAFMTPFVWMFIKTYEALRTYIIDTKAITTLVQMEYSAFEEATVPICSFVLKNGKATEKALCFRLSDFKGGMEVQKQKVLEAIENKGCEYFYEAEQCNFFKIPGCSIAYWVGENIIKTFDSGKLLSDIAAVKKGLDTGKNDRFLRLWYEVSVGKSSLFSHEKAKWIPLQKGGSFRKWYGNNEYVINWENNGEEIKATGKASIRSPQYYFSEGISWSTISSSYLGMRYVPKGYIFETAGNMMFFNNDEMQLYCLGLLCGKIPPIIMNCLNPTITTTVGSVSNIPIIFSEIDSQEIIYLTQKSIAWSQQDWDAFEASWDFKKHPLVSYSTNKTLTAFELWSKECAERFNQLKANEEKLNRTFIDIYGLQDELTPEVEDKDVTVRKADLQRDIKSLISYAVGCMFGRYSLEREGIVYAGGNFDDVYWKYKGQAALDKNGEAIEGSYAGISFADYHYPKFHDTDDWKTATELSFEPDADNCIPITDEEYFEDDIVGLFCAWLKKVYGEDTLEENLDFIANALGNKGKTSREVIRNYFLTDFIKDHIKTYQKRPIYWLFDSGKQNGFKALVYMHRWNADTIGNVRVEYLHRIQRVYEKEITRMQEIIDNSHDNKEISNATKRKEKLQKQIKETKDYDAKIAHLALSRIDIDLDDGVKVNYEKVQTADGKKMQILAKI
ncbi:BREX-1 system adenine-specific DNA-methyltransferase PglX [Ruminococcus sp. AM45-9BH]|nr:BREX-1 system adenine-specific DNA-methyltransferase PglX [Ruminococcus sp. AM18-44]RHO26845.1 BREX-1 system adenine-specific DNA-methyltransferase PglX [Ruminococcus sp. AM18-15]RHS59699.1 BREX-1 system adenine-specific DNA-methyltransferase PglX [Ruminococcus sp. AM45-9BH]RHS77311.1 BREX-1 system adenine-specific DNA-methyltransferase PglX [Ruminococcus sp. AM45-2]